MSDFMDNLLEHPASMKRVRKAEEKLLTNFTADEEKFVKKIQNMKLNGVVSSKDKEKQGEPYYSYALPLFKKVGAFMGEKALGGVFAIRSDFQRWAEGLIGDTTANNKISQSYFSEFNGIVFNINPKECNWSFRQRILKQECKGGIVWSAWRDRYRKTFYAEPIMTATFQSGNIMPIDVINEARARDVKVGFLASKQSRIPKGLEDLYKFLAMFEEPKYLPNGDTNYFYVYYSSYLFPDIILKGFFDPEAEIPILDSSIDPFKQEWTMPFIVVETTPKFSNFIEMVSKYDRTYIPKPNLSSYFTNE